MWALERSHEVRHDYRCRLWNKGATNELIDPETTLVTTGSEEQRKTLRVRVSFKVLSRLVELSEETAPKLRVKGQGIIGGKGLVGAQEPEGLVTGHRLILMALVPPAPAIRVRVRVRRAMPPYPFSPRFFPYTNLSRPDRA